MAAIRYHKWRLFDTKELIEKPCVTLLLQLLLLFFFITLVIVTYNTLYTQYNTSYGANLHVAKECELYGL